MKIEVHGPPCQRFGDAFKQSEIGRPGKQITTRNPLLVHHPLDDHEELGASLGFINGERIFAPQKALRVPLGSFQLGEIIQRYVSPAPKSRIPLEERAFSHLAHPRENNDWHNRQGIMDSPG
jgi:hypothetical protein